jgi:hypothetical protein
MKKFVLAGVVSLLITAGVAVAQQSEHQNDGSSSRGMMHGMTPDQHGGDAGAGHMGGMMNMMSMMNRMAQMDQQQMTKMMEQCSAMMGSGQNDAGGAKERQKQ